MGGVTHMDKIAVKDVSFSYVSCNGGTQVLSGINLSIRKGEFVSVVGPSGCGKSTLISLLAGLNRPTAGSLLLDGEEVRGTGPDRGLVFQHYSLFPWMRARDNILFALKQVRRGRTKCELVAIADRYLELVGLSDSADAYPNRLSGGMQQRVAIARAFALDAPILLMDEPFSAVDTKNRVALQELLLKLWDNGGDRKTVVFITHDLDEALFLADRVAVMSARTGSVRTQFTIPFARPRSRGALMKSTEYVHIRNDIVDLFHDDEAEILADGGSEVEEAVNG